MDVAEVDMPHLLRDQTGSIIFNAYPDTKYAVGVDQIDPVAASVDGANRYHVTMHFIYLHTELKVGMSGNVKITTAKRNNVLLIPERAILDDATGGAYVIVQDGTRYYRQRIVIGLQGSSGDTEVVSGLTGQETLVLNTDDASLQKLLNQSANSTSSQTPSANNQPSGTGSSSLIRK
jgi:multidrug efflux pump subunit AcrA (membrane-fusion protein)